MRIDAVRVAGRYRRDLGDIPALAQSIAKVGMLNPITVTSDGQLITGQRRLEACRSLGWDLIGAVVADDLDAAAARLTAERDENTERKQMTPEELVRLGQALEELERPVAKQRQGTRVDLGRELSDHVNGMSDGEHGRTMRETRQVVGEALGISGTTYERAKKVVEAAQNESLAPQEQEIAQAALADMNSTGNVHGNYMKIRDAGLHLGDGQTMRQKPVIQDAKKQRHAITSATASLAGIVYGLKTIERVHPDITKAEAAQWVDDLSKARRVIQILIRRLKERTQ